jgi:hypothetical protein
LSYYKDTRGGELLSRYGAVEFLIKFGEFLQAQKMSDVSQDCQNMVKSLLRRKAEDINYGPVKEQMKEIVEGWFWDLLR